MKKLLLAIVMLALPALATSAVAQATATPGKALKMLLLPKWLGNDEIRFLYDQVHEGAEQAAKELQNPSPLQFRAPAPGKSIPGQAEIVTEATSEGVDAVMISNNSGEQIVPALQAAHDKGIKVVSWDSPVHSGHGEDLFVAAVDFSQAGRVGADMAFSLLGPDGGDFAILSVSPTSPLQSAWIKAFHEALKDPKFAGFHEVDLVYGNNQAEASYNQALALVDKHPGLKLIMAPTTTGALTAAKAMQDRNLCGKVKVSGFGLPHQMRPFVLNGCAPEFALWSFVDLGYLTYYTTYLLATDAIKPEAGQQFTAGRMGSYTIAKDPNRPQGLRVLMGPFTIFDKSNIEAAVQ